MDDAVRGNHCGGQQRLEHEHITEAVEGGRYFGEEVIGDKVTGPE